VVKCLNKSTLQQIKKLVKSKAIEKIENLSLINNIIDHLFKDKRRIHERILWLGGSSIRSKLPYELKKYFKISLINNRLKTKFIFIMMGLKYDSLKVKNFKEFNKKWIYLKHRYSEGLENISITLRIEPKLLELLLKININRVKELLLNLFILEENKENLDLLFVQQSVNGISALAVDYFNLNELPSLELVHGVPCGPIEVGKTTKIAVYSQRDKTFLINHGVDKTKIVTTGCPNWDSFFDIKENQKTSEFLLLILDWILFTPSSSSYREIFEQVISMLKLIQNLDSEHLYIKLHPGQSEEEISYVKHLADMIGISKQVKVGRSGDIVDLLKRAKIVFTYSSSVGVEAILMKKPLIILDFFPNRQIEYEKYSGCLVAKNFQQLLMETNQILNNLDEYQRINEERLERTRRYFSDNLNGKSYKKVTTLCRDIRG